MGRKIIGAMDRDGIRLTLLSKDDADTITANYLTTAKDRANEETLGLLLEWADNVEMDWALLENLKTGNMGVIDFTKEHGPRLTVTEEGTMAVERLKNRNRPAPEAQPHE